MKTREYSFRKRFAHLAVLTGVCILLWLAAFKAVAQGDSFRVLDILQNQENSAVVGIKVFGAFLDQDVISLYTNDKFLKGKVIRSDDASEDGREVLISNISTDTFESGDNNIVAKLERRGRVVSETAPLVLQVRDTPKAPPDRPSVTVKEDGDQYIITASGAFKVGDTIVFFVNKNKKQEKDLTEEEAAQQTVVSDPIPVQQLNIGRNIFEAQIKRGSTESRMGSMSVSVAESVPKPKPKPKQTIVPERTDSGEADIACPAYTLVQKIHRPDSESKTYFGREVSIDGGTLVVSGGDYQSYIYRDGNGVWKQDIAITEADYTDTSVSETSVLSEGNTVMLGIPNTNYTGINSGSVHIYAMSAGQWAHQHILLPRTLAAYSGFGISIDAGDTLLAVGVEERDSSGSVYTYSRSGDHWIAPIRLVPPDSRKKQRFGYSVSVDGTIVAVGAPGDSGGAVYVYQNQDSQQVMQKIPAPKETGPHGSFGSEVLLRNGTLFIAATKYMEGAVYTYTLNSGFWQPTQKIVFSGEGRARLFGSSIAYERGLLLIGAPDSDSVVEERTGAVYAYSMENGLWKPAGDVIQGATKRGDKFGGSISFDGTYLAVGADHDDAAVSDAGAVYVYQVRSGDCPEEKPPVLPVTDGKYSDKSAVDLLEERKSVLEKLIGHTRNIMSALTAGIKRDQESIIKKQDRIVVYDERVANTDAQRRAAELRGITAPGIPKKVEIDIIIGAAPPVVDDSVRSREEVVDETRRDIGIVVPVEIKALHVGDKHDDIYRLQVFLNENGYTIAREGPGSPGNESAVFGSATERALRIFQLVNGIEVTGALDKATRDIILTYVSSF